MININIKQLMWDKGLTQTDIADIMGVNQSVVSKFIRGIRTPLKHHMDKMIEHFGEEVIKYYSLPEDAFKPQTQLSEVTILDTEVVEEMRQEIKEEIEAEEIKKTIVLPSSIIRDPEIDIKAEVKAGNLDEYAKPTQDILPLHQGKVYTYCDDMEPEIRAGEPVLVRLLPSGIPVVPGEMYFVDMPSGGKIRYVEKEENGKLHLKARNTAYGDIIIDREEVQSLWSVVLILRTPRSMSMKEATAQEMLANKDRHLDRLLDQMEKGGERERMLIEHILGKK
ncbi:MAG: LexA family transcriptional regulator [Alistipes sp.]|nr:LexA family transcriptional regulator [Alistipes sp.]